MPKLPPVADLPRVMVQEEEGAHRRECEEREARWDSELADTLATAEEVKSRVGTACENCNRNRQALCAARRVVNNVFSSLAPLFDAGKVFTK